MGSRLELQTMLEKIIGTREVYFQPPSSIRMTYPAIVYSRKVIDNVHANNAVYGQRKAYEIILIETNPDSEFVDTLSKLPYCSWDRHYVADNLNHDVFTIYF